MKNKGMKIKGMTMLLAVATVGTIAYAGGHGGNPAVKARNAHMSLYAFNIEQLGNMAKGATEYNADAAAAAAANLAALAALDQSTYWVPGTAQGEVDGSRAKAEIWTDGGMDAEQTKMIKATAALSETAGTGLEALQAGLGPVGASCSSCHKAYRGPRN